MTSEPFRVLPAPRPLTGKLTPEQTKLLLEVARPFASTWEWPTWDYVQRTMRREHQLDAREILSSLPRVGAQGTLGPSYGFTAGGDWRMLGPGDRVRLTIAAALPLAELHTILAEPFLRVLHHMIALQSATVPSPNEVTEVWLESEELASALPDLRREFLRALPEILSGEPATWGGGSSGPNPPHDWTWRKGIRETIDEYARAKTLEAYVARTCEIIEGQAEEARRQYRPYPIAPPPLLRSDLYGLPPEAWLGTGEQAGPAEESAALQPPPLDPERVYLPRLLLWLAKEHEEHGQPEEYTLLEFAVHEDISPEQVKSLVSLLIERGLVGSTAKLSNGTALVTVTDAGLAEAARMHADIGNRGVRYPFARNGILRWLLEVHDGGPANVADFLWSSDSFLHGHALTNGEVDAAVTYLLERKLLTVAPSGEGYKLTGDGQDCALQGANVSDYRSPQPSVGGDVYYNNIGSMQGTIGGHQNTVTQTNNSGFNLAEISKLIEAAALARQISPTLDLPDAEQAEVVESATALELEAAASAPDQGRLRRTADRFMTAITGATKATTALTMLAEAAHKAYTAVFG